MKIFFDGGCRPNPGRMEAANVAAGRTHILEDLGEGTSEEAEWLALIHALRVARELDRRAGAPLVLLGDAAGVVAQANGTARVRGIGTRHFGTFHSLYAEAGMPRIRHIGRSQNLAGIALARRHER